MIRISPAARPDDRPVGLPVLDHENRVVGTVSGVEADALRVDVSADAPEDTLRSLEWSASDAERLPSRLVAERTRDAVRLDA
ncbi:hypothetical protein [Halobacterium wangiae]|uniref:hypothetical protein n=1 Tax=Halobacterium wangiae TaxID=2902623 RepID=UPI001E42E52B|nr:hypothetical protein [Halobacterium wangiae]